MVSSCIFSSKLVSVSLAPPNTGPHQQRIHTAAQTHSTVSSFSSCYNCCLARKKADVRENERASGITAPCHYCIILLYCSMPSAKLVRHAPGENDML